MSENQKFEGWAVVEMLGHKKLAGMVSEQVLAGTALIRVDVPETAHQREVSGFGGHTVEVKPAYTKFVGVGSIYCITPCSEAIARQCATVLERWNDPIPVDMPRLIPARSSASTDDAEFETMDREEDDDDEDQEDLPL